MMHHLTCDDARLHDLADGLLDAADRAAVAAHLAACERCRAQLARIRALAERAARAPHGIEPARDLWPSVRARLATAGDMSRPTIAGERPAGRRAAWPTWALAAGVVIAVASSALTATLAQREPSPSAPTAAPYAGDPGPRPAPPARALAADYERHARDLAATLDAQRPALAPETVATVEAALRVVDSAIAEGRAALARDPGNQVVIELLHVSYRQKVDVLRRATELGTGI